MNYIGNNKINLAKEKQNERERERESFDLFCHEKIGMNRGERWK